jgi:dihydrofolate reductase
VTSSARDGTTDGGTPDATAGESDGKAHGASEGTQPTARLIVAMTAERLIGRDNDLPWHWSEDLKHFKRETVGQTVVMGRRSYESMGSKPLPKRTNLMVSRGLGADAGPDGREQDGVRVFGSLTDACGWAARAKPDGQPALWVLGGAQIFRAALEPLEDGPGAHAEQGLPTPEELVVTWVPSVPLQEGDVLFPFDRAWIESHYETAERWMGETGELEFVRYRLQGSD